MVSCQCDNCGATYTRRLQRRRGQSAGRFCSVECKIDYTKKTATKRLSLICANCGAQFERPPAASTGSGRNKSDRNFCSRSCSSTYNNLHKTIGIHRSKLEAYLESQLRIDFPALELICNSNDAIGSELDFYFPQLRLAIELNGIFHYEPIYGPGKLERIQANDQQKFAACAAAGIELCIIDISSVDHVTDSVKVRYYTIVKDLVTRLIGRAGDANVQAP